MYAQKIAREGVSFTLYDDGSNRFVLLRDREAEPGAFGGVNERLYEMYRREGRDVFLHRPVGVCDSATTLNFTQVPGFWNTVRGRDDYYRVIHSDLKRSHVPQDWARGFMPIISAERFEKWRTTRDRTWLEFEIPEDPDQLKAVARSYIMLLARGWEDITTTLMFRTILNNLGFDLDGKAVREILDDLLEEGFFKLSRNARNPHGFWKPSPYVRRYRRASISCDGAGDWDDPFSDRLTRSLAFFASIAAPFEACAKRPT